MLSLFNVLQGDIVLYENVLYVEVMYYFNAQVDFKISSKLIQASKGFIKQMHTIWRGILTSLQLLHQMTPATDSLLHSLV